MNLLKRIFAPRPDPRDDLRPLWQAVVDEARRPAWYTDAGAVDTVQGRFDMITAVLATVLVRMERSEALKVPSVMLTELFIEDMDGQLRELGIGDPVVGKHVGKVVSAMGGRLSAYREGLADDGLRLADAVARNMTLSGETDGTRIAAGLRALAGRLARTPDGDLLAGTIAQ